MTLRVLAKHSVRMMESQSGRKNSYLCNDTPPTGQGVRWSSRRNVVCGSRLASALGATGGDCAGATVGTTTEAPATGIAGATVALEALDAVPEVLCGAIKASPDCCDGMDNTARTGAFRPSASMASFEATDTSTYPGASSEPTAKGRAGFPSTETNAAPWPTLLAMTPESTNLPVALGAGPASARGVAPSSRANATGLDMSRITNAGAALALMGEPAVIIACVQYQPDIATNAHTIVVAVRQPKAFFSLNIGSRSSHSDASACKSLHFKQSRCPTTRRTLKKAALGFTLIELMVVLVIIGVLAALIVPNVLDRADDARVMAARTDVNNLNQALKLYKLDNQRLPSTDQGLQALIIRPTAAPVPPNWKAYLDKLPNDPWGRPYQYLNPGVKGEVDVMSLGADGQPGGEGRNADVGSWQ